ncbi:hypothetical protein GGS20DRAFT_405668 [Poronia punctata]|nr:hypothetical protein GGS20DRAFT_405668 [Poronia punctata]
MEFSLLVLYLYGPGVLLDTKRAGAYGTRCCIYSIICITLSTGMDQLRGVGHGMEFTGGLCFKERDGKLFRIWALTIWRGGIKDTTRDATTSIKRKPSAHPFVCSVVGGWMARDRHFFLHSTARKIR